MDLNNLAELNLAGELKNFALESTSCGVVISDCSQPDHPLVYVNRGFEKVTGYKREEVIGRNCRFLQGDDTDQEQLEILRHAIKSQEDCQVVLRNYRKDGTMFYNELIISPIRNSDGQVTNFIGIQNDVTEQELAKRSAGKSKSNRIAVKDYKQGSIRLLDPTEIIYIERDGRQVVIHTEANQFPTYFSVEKLEKKLEELAFYKANQGVLVNINYIEHMIANGDGTYDLVMKNKPKAQITASRAGAKSILQDLQIS